MRIVIKSFWPAIIWLILSTIAFCLPGQALPDEKWFRIPYFDKWIHVILLSVMIFFWCLPFFYRDSIKLSTTKLLLWIAVGFFGYGILMEFIQHYFIPHRSFDVGDIAADAVGCLIGFIMARRQQRLAHQQK